MIKAYKFRIYLNDEQTNVLENTLNSCRELYNAMLQQRIYAYRLKKEYGTSYKINYYSQANEISGIKKEFSEFNNIPSQVIQDVARRLDKTYDNFYRKVEEKRNGKNIKAGFPRFKSKNRHNSITYTQSGFRLLENGYICPSKIGGIRMFQHRPVDGKIKTLNIKRDSAWNWFAVLTAGSRNKRKTIEEHFSVLNGNMSVIGVDVGLKSLITDSNENHIEFPPYFRKSEKKIKKANRNLSRKKKYSKNWGKTNRRLSGVYRKTARQGDDYSSKLSRDLASKGNIIVFEDLSIGNMVKNHHLAKSIEDASWYDIIRKTDYKAEGAGNIVLQIDPGNTSKMCSEC